MGEVAAVREVHTEHGVAGLHHRQVDTHVGLGAGVRLDIGVVGTEELLGSFARELFGDVYELATAVVAATGVALRILIGHHRAHRSHHRWGHEVLRSNQLETLVLPKPFVLEGLSHLGVSRFDQLVVN